MGDRDDRAARRPRIPAVRNALAVLRLLSENPRPLTAAAIARHLGLPRSSTYQLLGVLCEEGAATYIVDARGYVLAEGLFTMTDSARRRQALKNLADPVMRALVEATGETAQLSVLAGNQSVCILKRQPQKSPLLVTDPGVALPAHLCASGRTMLAMMTRHEVFSAFSVEGSFQLRTGSGPRTLRELNHRLDNERAWAWSVELGWVSDGICCLAAPVLDAQGRSVAGLSLSFPAERYGIELVADLLLSVCRSADALTQRLGGIAPVHRLQLREVLVELQRLTVEAHDRWSSSATDEQRSA